MKRLIAAVLCLASLSVPLVAADQPAAGSLRFYGKVAAVNTAAKSLTVHNKRQNIDRTFHWDDTTAIVMSKKPATAADMKVGHILMVAYATENNENRATRIVIRNPSAKVTQ